MIEDEFVELIDPILSACGSKVEVGEEYRQPPLEVVRYYRRAVRLNWLPLVGTAQSVVAIVRQAVDIDGSRAGYERLLARIATAANTRFTPWNGLTIGLTAIVMTPEPIASGDDAWLRQAVELKLRRLRVVPFGLIRVNLGQEAMAMAVSASPDDLFPESARLADALTERLRRFVPLIDL